MRIALRAVVLGSLLAGLATGCITGRGAPDAARGFAFALIGDLGYFPDEERALDRLFAELNGQSGLAFVVHVGDLASPRHACTDEVRARRLTQFRASAHPLVFTPGDNDWTDCHEPAVKGGDPLERLTSLRTTFFAGPQTLGRRAFTVSRQSDGGGAFASYRENVRWDLGGVTFLTLHVTGSNNGLGRSPATDAEYAGRNLANLVWLREGFDHAKARKSRAVVIVQHANVFHELTPFPGKPQEPSGYTALRTELERQTRAFAAPVVLVHGDSHYFRIDKPLSPLRVRGAPVKTALENFTRVETFGTPYHHWVHATVDPDDPDVLTFRPRLVAANLAPRP